MTTLFLLEPGPAPKWLPFADSRPVAELRAGAWLIRERWESISGEPASAIMGPVHLHGFTELDTPQVVPTDGVDGPAVIGRSDFAPTGIRPDLPSSPACLVNDGTVVGWWVPQGTHWDGPTEDWDPVEIDGLVLHGAYDLITALEHLLPADVADFVHGERDELPDGCLVVGDPAEVIVLGANVEPGTIFDVRNGAIVIEQHSYVKSGTRLEGPIYIGAGTQIHGGQIANSSIGPVCRVRGEMSSTVMLGFANKGHDGFVGHSIVGRWVNLGALTTTSNLKNTYGEITLQANGESIETGRTYLGTLFGDHTKTAIGTMLSTGSITGVGANIFGAPTPDKYTPAFSWGLAGERCNLDGFLRTAERVMKRRQEPWGEEQANMLTSIYEHATR